MISKNQFCLELNVNKFVGFDGEILFYFTMFFIAEASSFLCFIW